MKSRSGGDPRLQVTILMGGINAEREVSLASGAAMFEALCNHPEFNVVLTDMADPWRPLPDSVTAADLVVIAMHGGHGEDGSLQRRLDEAGVAYLGSGADASRLAMDKHASKEKLRAAGILTPDSALVLRDEVLDVDSLIEELGLPLFVKPVGEGSSVGITKAHNREDLASALVSLAAQSQDALVEQTVCGKELTVAILDGEALPIIEIVTDREFYDYEAKYQADGTHYYLEHGLSQEQVEQVQEVATRTFDALGAKHLARVDIMHDGVDPWVLEMNTIPGMTDRSLVPKAAQAAGLSFSQLCERLIRIVQRERLQGDTPDTQVVA